MVKRKLGSFLPYSASQGSSYVAKPYIGKVLTRARVERFFLHKLIGLLIVFDALDLISRKGLDTELCFLGCFLPVE